MRLDRYYREILPCPEHEVFEHVSTPQPLDTSSTLPHPPPADASSAPSTPYPEHCRCTRHYHIGNDCLTWLPLDTTVPNVVHVDD